MTSYVTPRKNVAYKTYVGLVDQSNTKLLKANPTIASGDFKVSTDGGAFANLATLPSANPASGRSVMIDLSSSEMNGDNVVVQCVDAAGAEWCDLILTIQTTARQIDDLAYFATAGIAGFTSTQLGYLDAAISSRLATSGYTAPDNTTITLIAGYTDSIEGRLPAALVGGRMDSSVGSNLDKTGYTAALSAADAAKLAALWQLHGLDLSNDLTVSATARAVGTIAQTLSTAAGTTTVHRTA